jgi:hypothetical protein
MKLEAWLSAAMAAALLLAHAPTASAQGQPGTQISATQRYQVVNLGPCGPTCFVGDINDTCEVAGSFDVPLPNQPAVFTRRAFVWRVNFGTLQLDGAHPGGSPSNFEAFRINNSHVVVGRGSGQGHNVGLTWDATQAGAAWALVSTPAALVVEAFGINDSGDIAGAISRAGGKTAFAVLGGAFTDLGDLPHGAQMNLAQANAVNAYGRVAGTGRLLSGVVALERAFFWDRSGALIDLGAIGGGATSTHAFDLNASNIVVGDSGVGNGSHGARWRWRVITPLGQTPEHSRFKVRLPVAPVVDDLGALSATFPNGAAFAINDLGSIVGVASGMGTTRRAIGWAPGASIPLDLNNLILRGDPFSTGLTLLEARGVNQMGVISAQGESGGQTFAVALIPGGYIPPNRRATICPQPLHVPFHP